MKKIILILCILLDTIFSNSLIPLTKEEKLNNSQIIITAEEEAYINKKQRVYIASDKLIVPYFYENNNNKEGFSVDYLKYLTNKIGLEAVFSINNYNNKTSEDMLNDGDIDVIIDIVNSKENKNSYSLTKEYQKQSFSIITKKNDDYLNIEELKQKKIALLKESNLIEHFRKEYSDYMRIIEFESLEDIFDALKSNFVDAIILDNLIANYHINKFYSNDLKISAQIEIENFQSNLHIALKKENKILLNLYQKAINASSNEQIEKIYAKWINNTKKIKLTPEELNFIKNKTINIAYTDNWAPLSFKENNTPKGLGFDFWEFIAKENGIKYNTNLKKNFVEALNSIKNKSNDIIITTSKTKDREKYAIFSDIYFNAPVGIATLQDKDYIPTIETIKDKKIGVGKNHTAHLLLKEKYPDLNFVFIDNSVDGLNKLSNNKIYALVDIMPVLAHNIEKHGYSNIKITGSTGINFGLQMMIRDDYKILQSIINKTLINFELEDKNKIYNKWSKINYKESFDYSFLWKVLLPLVLVIIIILYRNRELLKYQKTLNETKNKLEESLDSFKTVVDLTIEGIVIVQDKKIVFSNTEMEKIFQIEKDKIIDTNISDLFKKIDGFDILSIAKKSKATTFEIIGLKKSQIEFPSIVKAKNIIFHNKQSIIFSIIDMSEIKEKENILANQSKMASLGEMIGNIAHQWRQPLSFISTSATGLKLQKEYGLIEEKSLIETLDNIANTTKFLSQTIDDFQDYLKEDKEKVKFNFKSNFNNVLNILKGSLEIHEIKLIEKIEDDLTIFAYPNELKQVILNILNNSKDALKNIENDRFIEINAFTDNNNSIIEIIDNGGGLDEQIINRVFEPYFTTKHQKQGTGLGLYMTHKIITQSINGEINIENCTHIFENRKYEKCTKLRIKIPNL